MNKEEFEKIMESAEHALEDFIQRYEDKLPFENLACVFASVFGRMHGVLIGDIDAQVNAKIVGDLYRDAAKTVAKRTRELSI